MRTTSFSALMVALWTGLSLHAGNPVPLALPKPDGKPGDASKPVKVYILAGQSNMVGMGDLRGASPAYPNAFLSADPGLIPGSMPIGEAALAAHGMYSAAEGAETGAVVSLFEGAYDPRADYGKLVPVKKTVVALGTAGETLPTLDGPCTVVASAWIDVPSSGSYTLHAGFGDSTHAVVTLEEKEVYRKAVGGRPGCAVVALEAGRRYPITVTYLQGGSAAFWMEQVDIPARGDLEILTRKDERFPYLLDDAGGWAARADVFYRDPRLFPDRAVSRLSVTSNNGKSLGPEVGFGWVMGTFHDEVVLLIKAAMGNRSLAFDFRPPSSGRTDPESQWESLEYGLLVKGVRETLERIEELVPDYRGQGHEIAGFCWFQGHKDRDSTREEYEEHLVHLIRDLRKELDAPAMPVVVATVGFGGYRLLDGPWKGVWEAQMAVGDPEKHPELAGTVASVDTRDFWRDRAESPRDQDYHYHRNPETYLLVGEAMGRAMVRLEGGRAEEIPKSDREARVAAEVRAAAAAPAPTAERLDAHAAAIRPLILDGALAAFARNPRYRPSLEAAVAGAKPASPSPILADTLDEAVAYYQAAGIHEYDWQPFGAEMKGATWEYHGFDLSDPSARSKGIRDLAEISPPGLPDWTAPGFDAAKAGWERGQAPFGAVEDPLACPIPEWYGGPPREAPATRCDRDVLLMRRTFDLPPLQEGFRYRIRVAGSVHHNCGEGYAIYVNGKLLAASKEGLVAWRRQGHLPRGGHIWTEFRDELRGGKVTIAVANFRMDNWTEGRFVPARAPLSVWMEEQKLPPIAVEIDRESTNPGARDLPGRMRSSRGAPR